MKAVRSLSVTSSARACQCSGWPRSHSCSGSLGTCSSVQGLGRHGVVAAHIAIKHRNFAKPLRGGSRRVSSAERASSDRPPVPDTVSAPTQHGIQPAGRVATQEQGLAHGELPDAAHAQQRRRKFRGQLGEPAPRLERAMRWAETSVVMQSEIRVGGAKGKRGKSLRQEGMLRQLRRAVGQEAARLRCCVHGRLGARRKGRGWGRVGNHKKRGGLGAKKGAETGTTRAAGSDKAPVPHRHRGAVAASVLSAARQTLTPGETLNPAQNNDWRHP